MLTARSDRWHSTCAKEGIGDDYGEAKKQLADYGHLTHVGIPASHLPATMSDDDHRDDVKKFGDNPKTFGHCAVEGGGLG